VTLRLGPVLALVVSIALCGSCGHLRTAQPLSNIFSPLLAKACRAYDKTLAEKRTPLRFESGRTVDTCNAYLQEVKASSIMEGVNNRIISQEYLVCPSIVALRSAGSTTNTTQPPASYGKELCSRLDLTTFPSSLRPRLDGAKRVLSALEIPLRADAYSCSFDTRDWSFRIEVVAEADFEKDGKSDWLVWLFDEAKAGNYRGYSALVVSDVSRPGLLAAKILP
jgi:hypothetical protein